MIVSVCADKGSPGVTTLATVLGLVWPGPRAVVEADTAGSDLSFRLRPAATNGGVLGGRLAPDPSIAVLATAAIVVVRRRRRSGERAELVRTVSDGR